MDSRLIAGAYSQHYRALEQENSIDDADKIDAIARAKKLTLETNKRRRTQAQKRKIEALREEKRRHEILTKRREEQKLATEKYQRSHIPPSARQHSGRRSPRRLGGGPVLEDALRLIRGSPRHHRPGSARDRVMSPRKENEDPFEKSYFEKRGHHMTRPGSGRTGHQIDSHARAELMDHSLQNFTSSKTLFEQQLEQQQSLLLEQQQQSLREFNNAVQREIESDITNNNDIGDEEDKNYANYDDSCSSVDSLEESRESDRNRLGNWSHDIQKAQEATSNSETNPNTLKCNENDDKQSKMSVPKQQPTTQFYLHSMGINSSKPSPLNQDMTASATYRGTTSHNVEAQGISMNVLQTNNQHFAGSHTPGTNNVNEQANKTRADNAGEGHTYNQTQYHMAPLKQISTDSLESGSSISTVSLVKTPAQHSSLQTQTTSNQGTSSDFSSMAWVSPSSKSGTAAVNTTSNNNESGMEGYNPRYASAISLSIWPGQGGSAATSNSSQTSSSYTTSQPSAILYSNNQRGTVVSTTPTTSNPTSGMVPSTYTSPAVKSDIVLKYGVVGSGFTSSMQTPAQTLNSGLDMNWQDMQYPLVQDYNKNLSEIQTGGLNQQQQQQQLNSNAGMFPQNTPSTVATNIQMGTHSVAPVSLYATPQGLPVTQPQIIQQSPLAQNQYQHQQIQQQQQQQQSQNVLVQQQNRQHQTDYRHQQFYMPQYQQQQQQSVTSQMAYASQGSTPAPQGIPVPAIRTIFPTQRPPVPKVETSAPSFITNTAVTLGKTATSPQPSTGSAAAHDQPLSQEAKSVINEHEVLEEGSEDDAPRIKGILKSVPVTTNPQQTSAKVAGQPRDSLELMRLQTEKKGKKKSVRFAEDPVEETTEEMKQPVGAKNMVITNSGTPVYRPPMTRPASAKVVSTTQKTDIVVGKVARAASAGTTRQIANLPTQASYAKNGQFSSDSGLTTDHSQSQNAVTVPHGQNGQPNIPLSPQQSTLPITAMGPSAVNRPRAAAHIIMSNPEHHGPGETGPTSATQVATTAHKSHLESKVKNINSSLMGSKTPMKVPAAASTVSVYHVARAGVGDPNIDYQSQLHHQAFTADNGGEGRSNGVSGNTSTQEQRQRLRDPSPASKRVPISNSVVTRTSIVPASTKISIPQPNMGTPSYSTSTAVGGGSSGNGGPVYDENGMRIDRTPTDDEITWLWDKVRNCLNKEEPSGSGAGNVKTQGGGIGNGVDQSRQPPTLSTKLIDGASLGFGLSTSPGVNGLRVGAGFFQPHPSPSATNNKVRPAQQQQGSYLRRYGLLKQRRATSATGPGSTPSQPPMAVQRASSAVHTRQQYQAGSNSPSGQQLEQEGPQPINQAYMPQDGVSESTAAFIMAERLAKQSLSDSHIQSAMHDAHNKQEAHNTRARLAVNRGGHSALSIEEQNLLASLDKLNERLRLADTPYTGTIHYHQPYQAHLPGFRANQVPGTENRRTNLLSPRSGGQAQQRSQSARIRQQTRQYR